MGAEVVGAGRWRTREPVEGIIIHRGGLRVLGPAVDARSPARPLLAATK